MLETLGKEISSALAKSALQEELEICLREAVNACPCNLIERDAGHRADCRANRWERALMKCAAVRRAT